MILVGRACLFRVIFGVSMDWCTLVAAAGLSQVGTPRSPRTSASRLLIPFPGFQVPRAWAVGVVGIVVAAWLAQSALWGDSYLSVWSVGITLVLSGLFTSFANYLW